MGWDPSNGSSPVTLTQIVQLCAFANAVGVMVFVRPRSAAIGVGLTFLFPLIAIVLSALTTLVLPTSEFQPNLLQIAAGTAIMLFWVVPTIAVAGALPLIIAFTIKRHVAVQKPTVRHKFQWSLRAVFGASYFVACNLWMCLSLRAIAGSS